MLNQWTLDLALSSDGAANVAEPTFPEGKAVESVPAKRRASLWRWLVPRFSLRTMLLLMTALCLVLGSIVVRAERQRMVCEELTRKGWYWSFEPVDFDFFSDDRATVNEDEPWWLKGLPLAWRQSHGVHYWRSVHAVSNRGSCNMEVLEALPQLRDLQDLEVSYNKYPADPAIWHLVGRLRMLRELKLWETTIDDEGLAHLQHLSRLTRLDLGGTIVGDQGIQQLLTLTSLEELSLDNTNITDESVKHLAALPNLKRLDLSDTRVTSEGRKEIPSEIDLSSLRYSPTIWSGSICSGFGPASKRDGRVDLELNRPLGERVPILTIDSEIVLTPQRLENLSHLRDVSVLILSGPEIGDAELAHLRRCAIVRCACFDRTSLSHEGFQWLGSISTLRQLRVVGSPVTAQDIDALSELPLLATLTIRDTPLDGEALEAILSLPQVRDLELTRCPLSPDAVQAFKHCKRRIDRLSLNEIAVSPDVLRANMAPGTFDRLTWDGIDVGESVGKWIAKETDAPHSGLFVPQSRPSVWMHSLACANVDDSLQDGLALRSGFVRESHILQALAIWPYPCVVDFSGAEVTPKVMEALAASRYLERLALAKTNMSDGDLRHAAGWTFLQDLDLAGCPITDAGASQLEACWRLERLKLDDTWIGDDSLKSIAKLRRLTFLSLVGTKVTDEGLIQLEGLSHLKTLRLSKKQIAPDRLDEFKSRHPACHIAIIN